MENGDGGCCKVRASWRKRCRVLRINVWGYGGKGACVDENDNEDRGSFEGHDGVRCMYVDTSARASIADGFGLT